MEEQMKIIIIIKHKKLVCLNGLYITMIIENTIKYGFMHNQPIYVDNRVVSLTLKKVSVCIENFT